MQLDTKALLAVNGGTHCGGETDSSGYASSSGSNSYGARGGGGGSGGGSSGGGSGGGGCSRFDLTPFINNTKKTSQTETSVSTSSGGGSCGGTLSKQETPRETVCSSGGNGAENEQISKTPTEKIMTEVIKKGDGSTETSGEQKSCYKKGSYQCDEYVEEMVRGAGYNPNDYYVDNPHGKNVDTHISELKNSQKNYETDSSKLTEGSYVVFMSDSDKKIESHAGLLVVNSDGSAYMYDNSSHNFQKIE